MAIYDINGIELQACYDLEGDSADYAYDANGTVVYTSAPPLPDYDFYNFQTLWQNSDMRNNNGVQSFDYFDSKYFWFRSASNGQGNVYVVNADTGTTIINSQNIVAGHANTVAFGKRYDVGDDFPLLYAGGASATPMIYENRITACSANEFSSTLIKTITFPSTAGDRFDAAISEDDPDVMITAGYVYDTYSKTDVYAEFVVCWWDLTNLTANQDGTYTPAFIKSIRTEPVYVNKRASDNQVGVKQCIREHDGLIWIATGYNVVAGYIYAFNETTGDKDHFINLDTTVEVEGFSFLPDSSLPGGYSMNVGFQNGDMRKYTFGRLS